MLGDVIPAFNKMREQGKTRFIGFTAIGETASLHKVIFPPAHSMPRRCRVNVLNQSAEASLPADYPAQDYGRMLERATKAGIGTIGIRVLAGGALSGAEERNPLAGPPAEPIGSGMNYEADVARARRLEPIVEEGYAGSLTEVAMRFAISIRRRANFPPRRSALRISRNSRPPSRPSRKARCPKPRSPGSPRCGRRSPASRGDSRILTRGNTMGLLEGDTALVTGAASGIGRGIAKALAAEGVRLVLSDIAAEAGGALARELDAAFVPADLTEPAAARRLFDAAADALGSISIFVHCASPRRRESETALAVTEERTLGQPATVGLRAGFVLGQAAGNHMKARRIKGRMLFITSLHAYAPRNLPHYSATKAGQTMVVKELARALGPAGIRVNALAPGAIPGGGFDADVSALEKMIPLGRTLTADDVAAMAVALLCDRFSRYVTGTTVAVDGGIALYNGFLPRPDRPPPGFTGAGRRFRLGLAEQDLHRAVVRLERRQPAQELQRERPVAALPGGAVGGEQHDRLARPSGQGFLEQVPGVAQAARAHMDVDQVGVAGRRRRPRELVA